MVKAFQSPIGTNKTVLYYDLVCDISKFQSPIGTNKTKPLLKPLLFQSPIGTNKTPLYPDHEVELPDVSIPYRYKQNLEYHSLDMQHDIVSIPYRYKQNLGHHIPLNRVPVFQSPIGTNKTPK